MASLWFNPGVSLTSDRIIRANGLKKNATIEPTGGLRLILIDGEVEVHYTIERAETSNCGKAILGIDKAYTKVFVDSDGESYGEGLGSLLTKHFR